MEEFCRSERECIGYFSHFYFFFFDLEEEAIEEFCGGVLDEVILELAITCPESFAEDGNNFCSELWL